MSMNLISGSTQRVMIVCNVDFLNVRNWVTTPPIPVPITANRIGVSIEFTIRKCVKHPNPSSLQQCKEVFRLAYLDGNDDNINDDIVWDNFKIIDTVAASHLLVSSNDSIEHFTNREIRNFMVHKVYFKL